MDIRHLRYFLVLAEELHFGHAARRLLISQPPLSVSIRQLEESIGARLFERSHQQVRLTDAGQALIPAARALIAGMNTAMDQICAGYDDKDLQLLTGFLRRTADTARTAAERLTAS